MKKLILRSDYPAGDTVMLTGAVRDLHRRYPGEFLTDVRTACKPLWDHNPYLTPLDEIDPAVRVIDCRYPLIAESNRRPYHSQFGFIQFLNRELALDIQPTAAHGDIHLAAIERRWMPQVMQKTGQDLPYWIIVSGGKYDYTIKWWETSRWQEVVDHFRGRILFVQVGKSSHYHPKLNGVLDLRGKTELRQLVRLVYHSQGVACPVTSVMHLAAAVEMRAGRAKNRACVVVAGGREPMQWEAYTHHQFIHNNGQLLCCDQGGCWKSRTVALGDGAVGDRQESLCVQPVEIRSKSPEGEVKITGYLPKCMDMISAGDVIRRIEGYFSGGALEYLTADQAKAGEPHLSRNRPPVSKGAPFPASAATPAPCAVMTEPDPVEMPWTRETAIRCDDLPAVIDEPVLRALRSRGHGLDLRHTRTHTPRLGAAVAGANGRNWLLVSVPGLAFDPVTVDGFSQMITFRAADAMAGFRYSDGSYIHCTGDALTLRLEGGSCVVTNQEGISWHFEVTPNDGEFNGRFLRSSAPGGWRMEATYDKAGRLLSQVTFDKSRRERGGIYYDYFPRGDHGGRLKGVEVRLDAGGRSVPKAGAAFGYYDDRSLGGAMDDLKSATTWRYDSAALKWARVGTTYYRYYLNSGARGFAGAVKMELRPDAAARFEETGADIDRASDDDLAPHASICREYDGKGRITLESRSAGEEWRRWSYLESDGAADRNWDLRIMESASDGTERTSYFDKDGLIARRSGEAGTTGALYILSPRMGRALKLDAGGHGPEVVCEPRNRAENLTRREPANAGSIATSEDRTCGGQRVAAHHFS